MVCSKKVKKRKPIGAILLEINQSEWQFFKFNFKYKPSNIKWHYHTLKAEKNEKRKKCNKTKKQKRERQVYGDSLLVIVLGRKLNKKNLWITNYNI